MMAVEFDKDSLQNIEAKGIKSDSCIKVEASCIECLIANGARTIDEPDNPFMAC